MNTPVGDGKIRAASASVRFKHPSRSKRDVRSVRRATRNARFSRR